MKRPRQLTVDELFNYAVKKLAGRAASIGEIRVALNARALDASDVEGVIARLKEYGYLNDSRFAESFATARLENERLGKSRVVRELRQRRIAPELAESTASKIYADREEPALIEDYIRRKYRTAKREGLFETEKDLAAAYRRLMRAGFTTGNSIRVLKRFAANPDLLDAFEAEPPEAQDD